ncbi:Transmembrane channel-like protein 6 [Myotis davidii]|uniref:Transmembrane channel-like protein 6 n=1 Tax=Myotis davidii TaxID=225400 RepID=L5MI25_MYODS|nr:Transmembrane channel-like protein 6 [Myotis davidii]
MAEAYCLPPCCPCGPALASLMGAPPLPLETMGGSGVGRGVPDAAGPPTQGRFTDTVMYYGYYSNATLNQPCADPPDGG